MMEDAIAKLVEFVEMASPAVWAVAQQQVKVQIFQSTVWVFALAAVVGACIGTGKKAAREIELEKQKQGYTDELWPTLSAICIVAGLISLAMALWYFTHAASLALNPDYYAIELLLDLVQ